MADKPITNPERELPAPHDMLIEAEEKDGKVGDAKVEQPTTTKPQEPSKKKALPLWLLPFIAFLIILLAGGMYFLNAQKETAKVVPPTQPTPTVTPIIPTATTQIFQNDTYGFSLEYPSSWIKENNAFVTPMGDLDKKAILHIHENEPFGSSVTVGIYDGLGEITAQKFVQNYFYVNGDGLDAGGKPWPKENLTFTDKSFNGMKVTLINGLQHIPGSFGPAAWVPHNNYAIFFIMDASTHQDDSNQKALDQLLTSLEFMDASPSPSTTQVMKACTMDAKICPDGSTVGRSGPNCEFAACPSDN